MVNLTEYEQEMLDGKHGRLKQVALKNIVDYAEVLGATELCTVTKATVFCGAHNYLEVIKSDDFTEVFSKMNLCLSDELVEFNETAEECQAQSCVSLCDKDCYEEFHMEKRFFDKNNDFIEKAKKAGVTFAGTCAPYLNGWIPMKGEHFVTTESGVTIVGNSIWGAACNSDGIEAAFWSSITGRTPKWGMHCPENRFGTHLVKVNVKPKNLLEWDMLGKAVGAALPFSCIPVIEGDFGQVYLNDIRQFLTSVCLMSDCELCHIVGVTPEALTREQAFGGKEPVDTIVIEQDALIPVYEEMCDDGEGEIDSVSLGCPHYDIKQIQYIAKLLKGRKVKEGVLLMIWTTYPIKAMAEENGYNAIIEEAGGKIYTGSCPGTIGPNFLTKRKAMVLDSLKQCKSVKNMSECKTYYGGMEACIDAACSGSWKEEYKWRP